MSIRDIRQTHTFVTLELSPAAFEEIRSKLREASYDHCFVKPDVIDMHGIAVTPVKEEDE